MLGNTKRVGAKRDIPVFDRDGISCNPATRIGFATANVGMNIRRDAKDRRQARQNVTRLLMGDPKPGRTPWS